MFNTTHATFIDDVLTPSYDAPVVVMFHAAWCGPCQSLKPLVERLAADLGFVLVGVDGGVERDLASLEGIRGVPTLVTYRDGVRTSAIVGGKSQAQVRDFLYKAGITQNKLEF